MSLHHSPKIVTSGLVLCLDAANLRSFRGEPTTNYVYQENARVDSSYSPQDLSGIGGTMVVNHPGCIAIYNINGVAMQAIYYNGGVGDPTNSQHAYWIYDQVLKKPVVQMIDKNGSWQAKSFGCGMNAWSTYGYGVGTKYTISWMQWVTNISKAAIAGMYTSNGTTANFWDGQSNGSTSLNSVAYKWERVYHTFTVTSNWDQTIAQNTIYMYGMYGGNYTIRIADVQLEIKDHPTHFCNGLTRGATVATGGGWKDMSINLIDGNLSGTFSSTSDSLIFNAIDSVVYLGKSPTQIGIYDNSYTAECFCYPTDLSGDKSLFGGGEAAVRQGMYLVFRNGAIYLGHYSSDYGAGTVSINNWYHIVFRFDKSNGNATIFKNGVSQGTGSILSFIGNANMCVGGSYGSGTSQFQGKIALSRIYNRALSDNEVLQNFNAQKSRFNL